MIYFYVIRIFEAFNQCYILTGKAKIKGIQDYISELMENDIKFIIFAHHIEILDLDNWILFFILLNI